MSVKTAGSYNKYSGKQLLEMYSNLDKTKYPDEAKAIEAALRAKAHNTSASPEQGNPEARWNSTGILLPLFSVLLLAAALAARYLYTPPASGRQSYLILSYLINIAFVAVLVLWAFNKKIFPIAVLVLYIGYLVIAELVL